MKLESQNPIKDNWEFLESRGQSLEGVHYSRWSGRLVAGIEGTIAHWAHKVIKHLGLYLLFGDYERSAKQRCVAQALAYGAQLQSQHQKEKMDEVPSPTPPDDSSHNGQITDKKFLSRNEICRYIKSDLQLQNIEEPDFMEFLRKNKDLLNCRTACLTLLEKALDGYGAEAGKAVIRYCCHDVNKIWEGTYGNTLLHELHLAVDGFPGSLPHEQTKPLVDFLLEQGADINLKSERIRLTPILTATTWGDDESEEKIAHLIERGADVNSRSEFSGSTPLHDAMSSGLPNLCETLLRAGARLDITDKEGRRPTDKIPEDKLDEIKSVIESVSNAVNIKG